MCANTESTVSYRQERIVSSDSLQVDVTWYTSTVEECDSTPFITADGTRVRDGIVAVSDDLLQTFEYGDSLYIESFGWFEVRDCMNSRWKHRIDIWCGDRVVALNNGIQEKHIYWNFREDIVYVAENGKQ